MAVVNRVCPMQPNAVPHHATDPMLCRELTLYACRLEGAVRQFDQLQFHSEAVVQPVRNSPSVAGGQEHPKGYEPGHEKSDRSANDACQKQQH
jgi:hypothetical protein